MKLTLYILFLLIQISAFGQLNKLKGTWINPSLESIQFNDTPQRCYIGNGLQPDENLELYIYDDTLSFQSHYTKSSTDFKITHIDRYDLKIISLTDSFLVATTVSTLSKEFFRKPEIKLIRQEYSTDENIRFEKIIFHTTECFGSCPELHIEFDTSKKIKYKGIVYHSLLMDIDSSLSGNFTGTISDSIYNGFISLLKTSQLNTLSFTKTLCCDGPIVTIIVYFNGKRKYLKSMIPPIIAEPLIDFLYLLNTRIDLKRTSQDYIFEE